MRKDEIWSKHTNIVHPASGGAPFVSTDGRTGAPLKSCTRCGAARLPAALEMDRPLGQYARRCRDREMCATAREGKS